MDQIQGKRILSSDTDVNSILLKVQSSRHVFGEASEIIRVFNRYGAVIVEFNEHEAPREQLLCFKVIFGETMSHDRADEDMISEIAVAEGFEDYLGSSNAEHFFHTDGAYSEIPPAIVALRCELPASSGGVSKLVSGEGVYAELLGKSEELLRSLMKRDALCVRRAGKESCQALFQSRGGRMEIRYRSDKTTTVSEDRDVQRAMGVIRTYLEQESNCLSFMLRPGQVLITDNTRILHARTAFDKNEPRKMHRLFFKGVSPELSGVNLGLRIGDATLSEKFDSL